MAEGGNAHFFTYTQEYDRGRQEKIERQTNKQRLGLPRAEKRYCNTTCMCRLSLAWVTSENSTMLLGSDILRLFFTGPYLVSSPLCSVSGVDCPSVDPRQLPLLLSNCQLPLSGSRRQLSFASPYHFRIRRDFFVQESFVWFRAKTDSSALAAYPHSATLQHFSDVNTTGCSQCSYIQIIAKRKVHCTLVIGKVRMAPTTVVTVLRLEFVAATVSAAVSNILKEESNITRLTSQ